MQGRLDFSKLKNPKSENNKIDFSSLRQPVEENKKSFSLQDIANSLKTDVPGIERPLGMKLLGAGAQIGSDVQGAIKKYVNPESAIEGLHKTISGVGLAATNPLTALKNIGVGTGELGYGLTYGIPEQLAHLGLIKPETYKKTGIPSVSEIHSSARKMFGLGKEEKPGEDFFSFMTRNAPLTFPIAKPVVKGAASIAMNPAQTARNVAFGIPKAAIGKVDPIIAARNLELNNKINEIKEKLPKAQQEELEKYPEVQKIREEARKHQEELDASEHAARTNINVESKEPSTIQLKLNKNENELNNINKENDSLQKELSEMKEVEPYSNEDKTHEENAEESTKQRELSEINLENAKEHHEKASDLLEENHKDIGKYLGKGLEHDVEAAEKIKTTQAARHEELKKEYNEIEEELSQKKIKIDNSAILKDKMDELAKLTEASEKRTPEMDKLIEDIKAIKNAKTEILASKWLKSIRSLEYDINEARKKAFKVGADPETREAWMRTFNNMNEPIQGMKKLLEEGIGEENATRLKEANKGWREDVASLYTNTTWHTIRKKERIEGDIMHTLRGNERGDVRIKNIIMNNPEIIKNVLGQRFAHKPGDLGDIGVQESRYIDRLPEFKQMVDQRNRIESSVNESKKNVKNIELSHKDYIKKEKEAHANKEEVESEIKKLTKENQDKIKEQESIIKRINLDIDKNKSKIKEIEHKQPYMQEALKDINEKRKNKKISLEKKSKLESEHKELENKIKKMDMELKRLEKEQASNHKKLKESRTGVMKYIRYGARIAKKIYGGM